MIRTGVPVTTWEAEGDVVIMTAFDILAADAAPRLPEGAVDPSDPKTLPPEWR